MRKRYQVFLSSTYIDLQRERQQVTQALLRMDCFPAGMELFPAADESAWALIRKTIDESDYYIVIVGGRYGATDELGVSYTEKEYEYAYESSKPIAAFLHQAPQKIPLENSELKANARARLAAFRARIEKAHHCNYWTNAENLGSEFYPALRWLMEQKPSTGWVRGDSLENGAGAHSSVAKTFDLFLASPMAAYGSDGDYQQDRDCALAALKAFETMCGFRRMFYAGTALATQAEFEPENLSVSGNLKRLLASARFVLIYPHPLASSVLVEAGVALAWQMPSVYFVRRKDDLPFLLRSVSEICPYVRLYEYRDNDHLLQLISRYRHDLFPPDTAT